MVPSIPKFGDGNAFELWEGCGPSPHVPKYGPEAGGWHNATLHSNVLSRDIGSEGYVFRS